jgi:hypothetical protein
LVPRLPACLIHFSFSCIFVVVWFDWNQEVRTLYLDAVAFITKQVNPKLAVFFLYIIIILLIIRVIKAKFEIYEWQRVINGGAEQTRHCQWRLCIKQCKYATDNDAFALTHPYHDPLPLDQHYYCWSIIKDVTDSDTFTKTPLSVTHLLKNVTDITVMCLLRATTNNALSFVHFKFYFYHSYYIIIIKKLPNLVCFSRRTTRLCLVFFYLS